MSDAQTFFSALYGGEIPSGLVSLLWTLPDKRSHWAESVSEAAEKADKLREYHDVYFGAGLSRSDYGPDRRCPAGEIAAISAVWADLDIAGPQHARKRLPPSEDAIMDLVTAAAIPPSAVIHSGHGLQAWWYLDSLWEFSDDDDRERGATLSRRWNQTLRLLAASRGWDVDSTHDLSRVLRVPGTTNRKDPKCPMPVRLLSHNPERRFSPADLAAHFLGDDEGPARVLRNYAGGIVIGDLSLSPEATVEAGIVEALCEADQKFRASWNRTRKDGAFRTDQSASAYDMSLATIAAHAGMEDQQIVNLIIQSRRTHKDDLKLRADYYRGTLKRARAGVVQTQAVTKLEEISDDPPPATMDEGEVRRTKILSYLSDMFGIEIVDIVKYTGEEAEFEMRFGNGARVSLGDVSGLIDNHKLRHKIAGETCELIPRYKAGAWEEISRSLLRAVREVDLGPDSTSEHGSRTWLDLYLGDNPPNKSDDNGKPDEATLARLYPYRNVKTERICLFRTGFRDWARVKHGLNWTSHQVGKALTMAGAVPHKIAVPSKRGPGNTTVEIWEVSAE